MLFLCSRKCSPCISKHKTIISSIPIWYPNCHNVNKISLKKWFKLTKNVILANSKCDTKDHNMCALVSSISHINISVVPSWRHQRREWPIKLGVKLLGLEAATSNCRHCWFDNWYHKSSHLIRDPILWQPFPHYT